MSLAIVAHRSDALGANGGLSGAFDSQTADLIVIDVSYDVGARPANTDISDTEANSYTQVDFIEATNVGMVRFACAAPNVAAAHRITVAKTSSFSSIAIRAYSGSAASPIGSTTKAFNNSSATLQPGSLTPPEDNCALDFGVAFPPGVTFDSIGSSFTLADATAGGGGDHYGIGSAYKIQTTAGAENPTATISAANQIVVMQTVIKSAGGGPPVDPPNATYAEDSQPCEGSNGTITPTNTGGAITSSAVASGTLPTGYTLNANGTISKVGASMLAADIGSRTVYVNLTNAAGTQSNVPVPIVITANPPLRHYAGSPFTKFCAHASSTSAITNDGGPAVPAAGYALVGSLPGLALNTTTALLTHDPDLTEWTEGFVALAVTGTSAGGQVGTFPISVRHSFRVTGEGTNAGGSDQAFVTLHVGGGAAGDSSALRRSSFAASSFARSPFRSSAIGRGNPFR